MTVSSMIAIIIVFVVIIVIIAFCYKKMRNAKEKALKEKDRFELVEVSH